MRRSVLAILACLLLSIASPGTAQSDGPTRGLRLPLPAVSLGDSATGLDINPAGLGLMRGFEAQLMASQFSGGVGGAGQGLFLASPLFWGISIGVAAQHISTQTLGARRFEDYTRLSLGLAYSPIDTLSFGLTLHRNFSEIVGVGGLTTLDMGLLWRPLRWLSIGAAVQDLTTPKVLGVGVHRAWYAGFGFRPGTDRLFLGVDLRIEEVARHFDPAIRIAFEPVTGLQLNSSIEIRDRDSTTEVTAQVGLAWNFDLFSSRLRGSVGYSSWIERGRGHDGFTVLGRFYRERRAALPEPSGRFVKLHLKGGIPEHPPPPGLLLGKAAPRWTTGRVLAVLGAADRDPRVSGVLVAFDGVSMGLAQAQEIHDAIVRLRKKSKRVIAYVNGMGNAVYLAASAAEKIFINPMSTFNAVGFASSVLFLRGVLDKIGVLPQFVAEGKYKSAPEMFTRRSMSAPAREARTAFLNDAFSAMVKSIARNRKKTPAQVRRLIDEAPLGSGEAVKAGLADGIAYLDELPKLLAKQGIHMRYVFDPGAEPRPRWGGYPRIAVIHVEGAIAGGSSFYDPIFRRQIVGATTVVRALRAARADRRVRAVVLRINSPGGSAAAGDRIWREVWRTRRVKPVVASFGNVAASAGYEIAVGANEIFSDPSTVTGSIGVFFGKASIRGLYGKLQVNQEVVKTAKRADIMSYSRPWTPRERKVIARLVRQYYDKFVLRVAKGRKLSRQAVHRVAQGRVWSGQAALEHKLVDRLGGLDLAIRRAKELAGYSADARVQVHHLPQPGFLARLVRRFRVGSESPTSRWQALRRILGAFSSPALYLRDDEPWAILPFEIDLR